MIILICKTGEGYQLKKKEEQSLSAKQVRDKFNPKSSLVPISNPKEV